LTRFLYTFVVCFLLFNIPAVSQKAEKNKGTILFSLGMGIDYGSTPSYTDYLRNELPAGTGDSIKTFSTGVEFFGCFEYGLSPVVSAKLDYSYFLRSNHYTFAYYVFDYTIQSHRPYLMIFYKNSDKKFSFKFGAGAGYHFHMLENKVTTSNTLNYTSSGMSFKGEFIFAPKFSEKLETYISGFVYGSTASSLKDENGNLLKGTSTGKEVNPGGYGVGARLGLSFYLN
jgi:hypothetical protein